MYGFRRGKAVRRDCRRERWTEDFSFDFGAAVILVVSEKIGLAWLFVGNFG